MEDLMETFTKRGATEIGAIIEAYWHKRGFKSVCTYLELINDSHKLSRDKYYAVRSNLIGGFPPEVYKVRKSVKI